MNPLVKKITNKLTETVLFCYLEIILEAFVHNWNRCIEVFNLNIRPFDIDYVFGVSNVCDASTTCDSKVFAILLDDLNSPSSVVIEDSITSEYSVSKNECIDTTTHDLKKFINVLTTEKVIALNELVINQDLSEYSTSQNVLLDAPTTYLNNFTDIFLADELFSQRDLNCYDVVTAEDSTKSEYFSSENEIKVDQDNVYFTKITGDKKSCYSKNLVFIENNKQYPHYLSNPVENMNENIHLVGDISNDFQKDPICDKCNLEQGTGKIPIGNYVSDKLKNDTKNPLCAFIVESKYRNSNDDKLKIDTETVQLEKFILPSISLATNAQSENVEKISLINKNGYTFGPCSETKSEVIPCDSKKSNCVISNECHEKIFLGKESSKHEEERKFPGIHMSNYVESNVNKQITESKISKNRVHFKYEVKTFNFEPLLSVTENFPSDQELIKENTYMDFLNDKYVNKSKRGCQRRRRNQSFKYKFSTSDIHKFVSIDKVETKRWSKRIKSRNILRKMYAKGSFPRLNNKNHRKDFPKIIKENTFSYVINGEEVEESAFDNQHRLPNQTCSYPEVSNAEIDHKNFIDKFEHTIHPKVSLPRYVFLKTESEDNSTININDNPDKQLSEIFKENTSSDVIKHVEELKCGCQLQNLKQDCSNPEFSNAEVDLINFPDEVELTRRPKLFLSRHVFRKKKIEDSPSINMNNNTDKQISELIKENTLSGVVKHVEAKESNRDRQHRYLNKPCSKPEFSNVQVDRINFIDKVKTHRRKLSLSRHVFENKNSENGSAHDENENHGKRLSQVIKENILTCMIKNEEVKEPNSDLRQQCRNQDCSIPGISVTDVDNSNVIDNVKPCRQPKLSLSCQLLRKKNRADSSSLVENENLGKYFSEKTCKNTSLDMIKKAEIEESNYGKQRRPRNQGCSIQEFCVADVENIVYIGKVERKKRPKLFCHHFRKKDKCLEFST